MSRYEVVLLSRDLNRWTMTFSADNFGHAEEQCFDALPANDASVIIAINRDYDPDTEWQEWENDVREDN